MCSNVTDCLKCDATQSHLGSKALKASIAIAAMFVLPIPCQHEPFRRMIRDDESRRWEIIHATRFRARNVKHVTLIFPLLNILHIYGTQYVTSQLLIPILSTILHTRIMQADEFGINIASGDTSIVPVANTPLHTLWCKSILDNSIQRYIKQILSCAPLFESALFGALLI